jgi:shikimate dehydrogenase
MKVFCILSDERAGQSKSPIMFSRVLNRQGINGTYVPFVVKPQDLGQAVQSIRVLHMAGANITVPYKEAVIPLLDVLSEGANIIGAVNTIVCDGDCLKGYNTNAIGVMDALNEAGFEVEGRSALVFGTGGAARAVIFILNWLRAATIFVAGRQMDKTKAIIDAFGGEPLDIRSISERSFPVDIVINALSVSSRDESPDMAELVNHLEIPGCKLVFDLNYGRQRNFWEEMARAKEIRFMDGLSALAYQARRAFALWTGLQVPPEEFLAALLENEGGR